MDQVSPSFTRFPTTYQKMFLVPSLIAIKIKTERKVSLQKCDDNQTNSQTFSFYSRYSLEERVYLENFVCLSQELRIVILEHYSQILRVVSKKNYSQINIAFSIHC